VGVKRHKASLSLALSERLTQLGQYWLGARVAYARTRLGRMRFKSARFVFQPPNLHLCDPTIAEDFAMGLYVLSGRSLRTGGRVIFDVPAPSPAFAQALHGFEWLRHFDANERVDIRAHARGLLLQWMDRREAGTMPDAELPEAIPARVANWIMHSALIVAGADLPGYQRVLDHLARDAAMLALIASRVSAGVLRLDASISLTIHVLGLDRSNMAQKEAETFLQRAMEACITPEGCLKNRDAGATTRMASQLIALLALYRARNMPAPSFIGTTLLRMVTFLRMMQHPDGGLALFHGAGLAPRDLVAQVTQFGAGRISPIHAAPEAGFERLENEHNVLIVDKGHLPPPFFREKAGASALAFEFSTKADRLIVNCGVPLAADMQVASTYRSSVAHSTLLLDDEGLAEIVPGSSAFGKAVQVIAGADAAFPPERHIEEAAQSLILRHDGLAHAKGYRLERKLTLDHASGGLLGQDKVIDVLGEARPCRITLLFHLGTRCVPRALSRPDCIVLKLPHQPPGKDLWLFEAPGFLLELQESRCFIMQDVASPKTQQIVLEAVVAGDMRIDWRLIPFRGA
jgi:uncharacterized heparinase superfamily protein